MFPYPDKASFESIYRKKIAEASVNNYVPETVNKNTEDKPITLCHNCKLPTINGILCLQCAYKFTNGKVPILTVSEDFNGEFYTKATGSNVLMRQRHAKCRSHRTGFSQTNCDDEENSGYKN